MEKARSLKDAARDPQVTRRSIQQAQQTSGRNLSWFVIAVSISLIVGFCGGIVTSRLLRIV